MSDQNNNIQNEEALWDLLSSDSTKEAPAEKPAKAPKHEPKFAKPEPAAKAKPEKASRKIDGFFLGCMAGVAAVSVAATLLISGAMGGSAAEKGPGPVEFDPPAVTDTVSGAATDLERENAELRAQLEQQRSQIKNLENQLRTLMGSVEFLSTAPTDSGETNEVVDAQLQALQTLAQIQEAYADFDRERLEELIPQMDEQIAYLPPDALNTYYLILEYVEQPSNG